MTKQDQDYSTKVSGYLGKFDLDLPYLKTCEIYSLTKRGKPSKKSSFKLPKQGMMLNGQLFQQKIWEPVILESESGSLPTPSQPDYKGGNGTVKDLRTENILSIKAIINRTEIWSETGCTDGISKRETRCHLRKLRCYQLKQHRM